MALTLAARFHRLYHSVEGTREQKKFAFSYDLTQEDYRKVTPVNPWHRRILSQLDLCLQMGQYGGVDIAGPVHDALTVLEEAYDRDGVLTNTACALAEEKLLPLAAEAKAYTLLMVGHAHLDMNWMWSWDETVATVVNTFKTMLRLMEEYPDFCFSQSQASTYKIIEDFAPELMPQIQARIREGRWEVTASAWVETDKNMPSTESLLNHIRCTKEYLRDHWDIDPASLDLDFSPDTFGHSAFLPELDALGGVKYYYHCRGIDAPELVLYRWQAPTGKELLMYKEPYWYNSGINSAPAVGLPRVASLSGGLKTGMAVYGVGDHGGGPTRRDLERAREMMDWPVFPTLRFGTLHQYFALAEPLRDQLPLVDHELNMIFTGCYSTQSRIKKGNRRAEEALRSAETLCALSATELGTPYPRKPLDKAWQNTLFTHFHDILTGSCVQDTREHAMGLYQEALALANTRSAQALEALAKAVDTSGISVEPDPWNRGEGAGVGFGLQTGNIPTHEEGNGLTRIFQVFNSTGTDRQENLRLTVWDWPGDIDRMYFTDGQGNPLPFDFPTEEKTYWAHRYFTVPVTVSVPAWGYSTLILREATPEACTAGHLYTYQPDRQRFPFEDIVLENDYLKARFDGRTGALVSYFDKEAGAERIPGGKSGGLRYIRSQRNDMSAWVIDRYLSVEPVTELLTLKTLDGKLEPGLVTEHRVKNSRVTTTATLGARDRYLKIQLHIDWLEEAARGEDQPLLNYCVPLADTDGQLLCDVPGGVQWRQAQEQDVPCLRYAASRLPENRCVALVCDSKYGFRLSRGELSVTLINTAYNPDPYPERGIQDVTVCLLAAPAEPAQLSRLADCCLIPLQYVTNSVHPGTLPHAAGLLKARGDTAVFGNVFMEDNRLRLRITEVSGQNCPVTVTLPKASQARAVDLFGNPLPVPVAFENGSALLTLSPFQTLFLELL